MVNRMSVVVVFTALLCALGTVGCDDPRPPTGPTSTGPPSPPPPSSPPLPILRVGGITPNKVATVVPTTVTIYGEGFVADARVSFGGIPATLVTFDDGVLTAVTPAHPPGQVDVIVTTPDGRSARLTGGLTFEAAPPGVPAIQSVSPALGPTSGGTWLRILGSGFDFGTSATVGGVPARTYIESNQILNVKTPPHAAGRVDIVVMRPDGEARLVGGFTYAPLSSFNFNGVWKGIADGDPEEIEDLSFTITNGLLVSVSCGSQTLTLSPAFPVSGGEFSYRRDEAVSMSGRMLSVSEASGDIHFARCRMGWIATKQ